MQNIKFVSIFAACGFVFSFLIGLLSKSKFYIVLLKALLFGVIFGVLALLISVLYNKFLKDDNSDLSETSGDNSDGIDTGSNGTSNIVNNTRDNFREKGEPRGGRVNFVVQDEELGRSESDNHFVVGDNHQMLNNTDVSSDGVSSAADHESLDKAKLNNRLDTMSGNSRFSDTLNKTQQSGGQQINAQSSSDTQSSSDAQSSSDTQSSGDAQSSIEANKFVPLKNFETVTNLSGKEAVAASAAGVSTVYKAESDSDIRGNSIRNSSSNIDDDIDTLPDMGGFSFGSDSQKEDSEDNEYSGDTDDSFGSSVSSSLKSRDDSVAEVKDASLIAKAISSVLADENS